MFYQHPSAMISSKMYGGNLKHPPFVADDALLCKKAKHPDHRDL